MHYSYTQWIEIVLLSNITISYYSYSIKMHAKYITLLLFHENAINTRYIYSGMYLFWIHLLVLYANNTFNYDLCLKGSFNKIRIISMLPN